MGAKCSVCFHEQTEAISMDILNGHMTLREIAAKYGLSTTAVHRHKQHIPAQLAVSHEAEKVAKADSVMARIIELDQRADTIYKEAMDGDDPGLALKALKELREITGLYAKLTGEIQAKTVTNNTLIITPEWVSMRSVMLKALEPYPEARRALVGALGGFDVVQG